MRRLLSTLALLAVALFGQFALVPGTAEASVWPSYGQASYVLGSGATHSSAHQGAVPIASVAKVMTAYLVLRDHRLPQHVNGFVLTVHRSDVADYWRRLNRGESVVAVRVGERLTERQAVAALLLPSANNIAIMLARRVSKSVQTFAAWMNSTARRLGMTHTHYTDPSGFDADTRSTAADQLKLARTVAHDRFLSWLVSLRSYRIPVAGTMHSTDSLLRHDGFVGTKTGSMDSSGGCFMFRSHRLVHGHRVDMVGVVLGQRVGTSELQAGLDGARRLVDRVAPHAG